MKIKNMPYYRTEVSVEKSQADVLKLLKKYGITNKQWTVANKIETLKFGIYDSNNKPRVIELQIPQYVYGEKAVRKPFGANQYELKTLPIPEEQKYRIFYHSLKGILESVRFNTMSMGLEDVFYAMTLVKIGNKIMKIKQLRPRNAEFLLGEGT